jgi:hypothetical protein
MSARLEVRALRSARYAGDGLLVLPTESFGVSLGRPLVSGTKPLDHVEGRDEKADEHREADSGVDDLHVEISQVRSSYFKAPNTEISGEAQSVHRLRLLPGL